MKEKKTSSSFHSSKRWIKISDSVKLIFATPSEEASDGEALIAAFECNQCWLITKETLCEVNRAGMSMSVHKSVCFDSGKVQERLWRSGRD